MRVFTSFFLLCFIGGVDHVIAQNLLRNPGFEAYIELPVSEGDMDNLKYWDNIVRSADYLNNSYTGWASQMGGAYKDAGYVGFASYGNVNGSSEAISQALSPHILLPGNAYAVSFFAKLSNTGEFSNSCGGIEIYGFKNPPPIDQVNVHVSDIEGATLLWNSEKIDHPHWKMYSGCIYPQEAINYIAITLAKVPGCKQYVYLDEVNLWEPLPVDVFKFASDTAICEGDSVLLSVPFDYPNFQWSDGYLFRERWVKTKTKLGLEYGVACKKVTTSFHIDIITPNSKFIPEDTVLCYGKTIQFNIGELDWLVVWQGSDTTNHYKIISPGVYNLKVQNKCGIYHDAIQVAYEPQLNLKLGRDTVLCEADIFNISIAQQAPSVDLFWNTGDKESSIYVDVSGLYTVEAVTRCEKVKDSIIVEFKHPPSIDLPDSQILCRGTAIELFVEAPTAQIIWNNSSLLDQLALDITDGGVYAVRAENECGADEKVFEVIEKECECRVDIPTAFSANNDGLNETFSPIAQCDLKRYLLTIYNRWGEIVFVSNNPKLPWNGFYKGRPLSTGVYFYTLQYDPIVDPSQSISGSILLMR